MDKKIYYDREKKRKKYVNGKIPRADLIIKKGTYKGYNYIIMGHGSHPTAYVEIPTNSNLYGENYPIIDGDIDVHGGLTFSGYEEGKYLIGWDYAHYGDVIYYPQIIENLKELGMNKFWTIKEIVEDCKDVIKQLIKLEKVIN